MLDICKSLFKCLNSSNIRYCHWKSNIRLSKSLNGETDLDLLIENKDKEKFERVLQQFTIKRIKSPSEKQYYGLEDYLGFDNNTGKLIHLHIHYMLVLGQKYTKNYYIPIEILLFENLIIKNTVRIPCPEMELILLVIRAHMKVDIYSILKHLIKNLMGEKYIPYPKDIEEEFVELIYASNMEKLKKLLLQSNLPLPEEYFITFFTKLGNNELRFYDVSRMKKQVLLAMKNFRHYKGFKIHFKHYSMVFRNLPFIRKYFKSQRKTLEGKGFIYSIVGADGSGKSTLVTDLNRWLSWKLVVSKLYYGIPKSNFIKYLSWLIRGLNKFRLNILANLLDNYMWLFIARNRFNVFKKSVCLAVKGNIVITDRFPLKDFWSMQNPMDGPRLNSQYNLFCKHFLEIEKNYYERIQTPDHVFVLQADIEELRKRKTDLEYATHRIKAQAVNGIKESAHIHLIDANRPYSEVVLDVKREIWKTL